MKKKINCKLSTNVVLICSLLIYASFLIFPVKSISQPPSNLDLNLNGVASTSIIERFGKPDRKVKSGPVSEMWYYDRAVVFFTNRKVVAWTHAEDLIKSEIDSFKNSKQNDNVNRHQEGWKNPWTPEEEIINEKEILDELIHQKNS